MGQNVAFLGVCIIREIFVSKRISFVYVSISGKTHTITLKQFNVIMLICW